MLRSMAFRWMLGSMLATAAVAISWPGARAEEAAPRVFKPGLLMIQAPAAKVGKAVTVPVVFRPETGWLIDKALSIGCKLFPPEGVTADKRIFENQDAVLEPQEGRLDMVLIPHEAGKKVASAALTYGVYKADGTGRDIKIVKVIIEMDVK